MWRKGPRGGSCEGEERKRGNATPRRAERMKKFLDNWFGIPRTLTDTRDPNATSKPTQRNGYPNQFWRARAPQ